MIRVCIEDVLEAMCFASVACKWEVHLGRGHFLIRGLRPDPENPTVDIVARPSSAHERAELLFDECQCLSMGKGVLFEEKFWMSRSFCLGNLERWAHCDAFPTREFPKVWSEAHVRQMLVWAANASNKDDSPGEVDISHLGHEDVHEAFAFAACARLMEALWRAKVAGLIKGWRYFGPMSFDVRVTDLVMLNLSPVNAAMTLSWLPRVIRGDERQMPAFLDSMSHLAEHFDWNAVCAR